MRLLIAGALALLIGATDTAAAATLAETGDAGDLPGTAQTSEGAQSFGVPLDSITGEIASSSDQDMFAIFISDPAGFSASTNNAGTDLTDDDDTMLFLFAANGLGVLGNDDADVTTLKSAIPIGSLSGPSGVYFIVVSIWANTPIGSGGEIFDLAALVPGATVGPSGPGGAGPISGWDVLPDPAQTGPYRIELTGATFVPEPSTVVLTALGLTSLSAWRRRS